MIWKNIELNISDGDRRNFIRIFRPLQFHMERSIILPYPNRNFNELKEKLSNYIIQNLAVSQIINEVQENQNILNIQHHSNEILNLPWQSSYNKNNEQLQTIENLFIVRSLIDCFDDQKKFKALSKPLKILVVISAPEGQSRFSYEHERYLLLKLFESLIEQGNAEIDFTYDATLETIGDKLNTNQYHIFHYSGHSKFDREKNSASLAMEDLFLNERSVSAEEFAQVLKNAKYKVPLVVLSSCQSAQGNPLNNKESEDFEKGLSGITNLLLAAGIPAVIGMGLSIQDLYAIIFTTELYKLLAGKQKLLMAYKKAIDKVKDEEYKNSGKQHEPLQWIIPNLYVSQKIEELVDWNSHSQFIQTKNLQRFKNLIYGHDENFIFIGRKKEIRNAIQALMNQSAVIITGQWGLGKTTLAENVLQRLAYKERNLEVFIFKETAPIQAHIINQIEIYLKEKVPEKLKALNENIKHRKTEDQDLETIRLNYYITLLTQITKPLFFFDNIETFLNIETNEFLAEYKALEKAIEIIATNKNSYTIITSRYPLKIKTEIIEIKLTPVNFTDYYEKIKHTDFIVLASFLYHVKQNPKQAKRYNLSFIDLVQLLCEKLGGNYKALDWFIRIVFEKFEIIPKALQSKDKFLKCFIDDTGLLDKISHELLFDSLFELLSETEKNILRILLQFDAEVTPEAIEMQTKSSINEISENLNKLYRFTFCEKLIRWETDWYIVNAIVKQLVQNKNTKFPEFSHNQAGVYFESIFARIPISNFLEHAFEHYIKAENENKINELGLRLSNFYYNTGAYQYSLLCGLKTYHSLKEKSSWNLLNLIGLNLDSLRRPSEALDFYNKALSKTREIVHKSGEGAILNNISQIYHDQGDYDTALKYLKKSLKIQRKIDNKSGEGRTLNNISQIYDARSDYDTALQYLEQSLKIHRELDDKSGEGDSLNNISEIYRTRGNYDTALQYLVQSLKIQREIDDKSGEGATLNNISLIYEARGDYDTALQYLEQSVKIQREIDDKSGEGATLINISQIHYAQGDYDTALKYLEQSLKITSEIDKLTVGRTLNKLGQIYNARGDNDKALKYLEQSLKIQREIGDKSGEGATLNNISLIYGARGDYDTALQYLEQSLKITKEIGDKSGEGRVLNNIGQIYDTRRDYDTALKYLGQSLKIQREIGDKSGEETTLNNIGQIYSTRRDYDTALKYLQQSLNITKEIGDKSGEERTLNNIGQIHKTRGGYHTALKYMEQSLKIQREIGNWYGMAISLFNIGKMYLNNLNREMDGLKYIVEAYKINLKVGNAELHNSIISIFRKRGIDENKLP